MNAVEFHAQLSVASGRIKVTMDRDYPYNSLTRDPFPHSHPKYELHYIDHGSCILETEQLSLVCPSGHFLLVPAHCIHRLLADDDQACTISLRYAPEYDSADSALSALACAAPCLVADTFGGQWRLMQVREELMAARPAYGEKIQGELLALLADLSRALGHASSVGAVQPDETRAEHIQAYLAAHKFEPDCSCAALAREMNLSVRQVQRLCLQYYNATFRQMLTGMRMDIAAYRLRTTDVSVTELAEQLGYASTASFSAAYKRHFGKAPTGERV